MTQLTLPAADGFPLAATRFAPEQPLGRVALVASAMGVKRRYYGAFAQFLADSGYTVYTFDYRGIGDSIPESGRLRGFRVRLPDWASKDAEGMVQYIKEQHAGQPLCWLGHSVGGQLMGWLPSYQAIDRAVFVASQSGHWRLWHGWHRPRMWAIWHLIIPGFSHLFGYLPAKRLRLFENLPKGVALDWARWGRHRDYLLGYANQNNSSFSRFAVPILSYSFTDDQSFAPPRSVERLLQAYPNCEGRHVCIDPKTLGQKSIGHFGFFRETLRETLWKETLHFLNGC